MVRNKSTSLPQKRLKEALRRREEEIELLCEVGQTLGLPLEVKEIMRKVPSLVLQATEADVCSLYLMDEGGEALLFKGPQRPSEEAFVWEKLEIGQGVAGWVAQHRKLLAIDKGAHKDERFSPAEFTEGMRFQAVISVPMVVQGRLLGVLSAYHKRAHRHQPREINLLEAITQQISVALENARLYEETHRKALQLDTLSMVSKTIISNYYLEEILQLIVTMTAQMMNSKICSLMLLDEEGQQLHIKATQSLSEEYLKKPPLRVGESISGKVVQEKGPITVLDVTREAGYKFPGIAKKEGLCSLLSVPMMIKDKVIGVINCYTSYPHQFSQEEIKILSAVASQAAVAIENTILIEKASAMEDALETRKLVERAKGLLMEEMNLSEAEAFKRLQRQSMNTRRPIQEVAQALIVAHEMREQGKGMFRPLNFEG